MDSLTLSPSLLDIICLLNHKDILNCTRVNRRLYDTIRSHRRILPRPETHLVLCRSSDPNHLHAMYIHIHIGSAVFYLTETRIRLRCCPNRALWQLIQSSFVQHLEPATNDERYCFSAAERHNYECVDVGVSPPIFDIRCRSMEDGMIMVMSFAFERYHLTSLTLGDDRIDSNCTWTAPDQWYDIIEKLLLKSRTKCKELRFGKAGKRAVRLYEMLGCQNVHINTLGIPFDEFVHYGSFCWTRNLLIILDKEISFKPFKDVIDQWKRGTERMVGFRILNNDLFAGQLKWNEEEVVEKLSTTFGPSIDVKYANPTEETQGRPNNVEVRLGRPGDDFVLRIIYSRTYGEIMMYDLPLRDVSSLEPYICEW